MCCLHTKILNKIAFWKKKKKNEDGTFHTTEFKRNMKMKIHTKWSEMNNNGLWRLDTSSNIIQTTKIQFLSYVSVSNRFQHPIIIHIKLRTVKYSMDMRFVSTCSMNIEIIIIEAIEERPQKSATKILLLGKIRLFFHGNDNFCVNCNKAISKNTKKFSPN